MKNYFDFIIYLAFSTSLLYENKKSITLEQLHNYRKAICKKNIEYHNQFSEYEDSEFEENLRYFHSSNIDMSIEDEKSYLLDFINNNDNFYYKDGTIFLKDNITYDQLEKLKFEGEHYITKYDKVICGELIGMSDNIECLDILKISKLKNSVNKIIDDEKKIENAYQTFTGEELENNIKKIQTLVKIKMIFISKLENNKLTCCHRLIKNLGVNENKSNMENEFLLSDKLMDNDKFYILHDRYIDRLLHDKYQKAIFYDESLTYYKLIDIMNNIWLYRDEVLEVEPVDPDAFILEQEKKLEELESFTDEFDENDKSYYEEYNEEDIDLKDYIEYKNTIDILFYLNYIKNINKYIEINGNNETLEKTKRRLLYLLDGYDGKLYKKEYFEQVLNTVSMDEIDYKEDLDGFYTLSRVFLLDILEGNTNNDTELRKLLFILTYYHLTKDKRIERILNKYKKTDIGIKVYDVIVKKDLNILKTFNLSITKKLINGNN